MIEEKERKERCEEITGKIVSIHHRNGSGISIMNLEQDNGKIVQKFVDNCILRSIVNEGYKIGDIITLN